MNRLSYFIQIKILDFIVARVLKSPMKQFHRLVAWGERFDKGGDQAHVIKSLKPLTEDPNNVWSRFIVDLCKDVDHGVLKAFVHNFAINASFAGKQKQTASREKYGCNIPWAILMDPTTTCNLRCIGCWAADYENGINLGYKAMDSIVRQANDLGTYLFIFSGGEPLIRKDEIIRLCEEHPDCAFTAFTNGTLIDEAFVKNMERVKNFAPIISVEGFEKETDARRGQGTYRKAVRAMALLKEHKQLFGISCCYTHENVETIGSEAYFDQMIAWGAKFCWFFTFIPIGKGAKLELLVTPEQRTFMYRQVRAFRKTKPIFTLDFWNDGEFAHGCIAGGRSYLHINANGDYEPCAFIHYSDSNVRDKTLVEALQSPLFKAYQAGQPWNENHLRPCPLLDNPELLVRAVESSGAKSTNLESPEDVHDLAAKTKDAAARWAPVADELWACSHSCAGCEKK